MCVCEDRWDGAKYCSFLSCLYTHPLALVLDDDTPHTRTRQSLLYGVLSCPWARTGRVMARHPRCQIKSMHKGWWSGPDIHP